MNTNGGNTNHHNAHHHHHPQARTGTTSALAGLLPDTAALEQLADTMTESVGAIPQVAYAVWKLCDEAEEHKEALLRVGQRALTLQQLANMWKLDKLEKGAPQRPSQETLDAIQGCLDNIRECIKKGEIAKQNPFCCSVRWWQYIVFSGNPRTLESEEQRLNNLLQDFQVANDIETLNKMDKILGLLESDAPKAEHEKMRQMIFAAKTVQDLKLASSQIAFTKMMDRVATMQKKFGDPWVWSVCWANARQNEETWADPPEEARWTALKLLQCLYNLYKDEFDSEQGPSAATKEEVFGTFGPASIARMLKIFLPMDKANAFYKMDDGEGVHWYCKNYPQERQAAGVPENANGMGALNKRYVKLFRYGNEYLQSKGMPPMGGPEVAIFLEQYFIPEASPRFRKNHPSFRPTVMVVHVPMVVGTAA